MGLAQSPTEFAHSGNIVPFKLRTISPITSTSRGLRMEVPICTDLREWKYSILLRCYQEDRPWDQLVTRIGEGHYARENLGLPLSSSLLTIHQSTTIYFSKYRTIRRVKEVEGLLGRFHAGAFMVNLVLHLTNSILAVILLTHIRLIYGVRNVALSWPWAPLSTRSCPLLDFMIQRSIPRACGAVTQSFKC
jgi:hypothetical protein